MTAWAAARASGSEYSKIWHVLVQQRLGVDQNRVFPAGNDILKVASRWQAKHDETKQHPGPPVIIARLLLRLRREDARQIPASRASSGLSSLRQLERSW